MDNDDRTIGQILGRREALVALSAAGVAFMDPRGPGAGALRSSRVARVPACVVRPAQTEGPYFIDERLDRSDIRGEPGAGQPNAGASLSLGIVVSTLSAGTCAPLRGAVVDLWQCDADGVYAGVRDINGMFDTRGKKFLRGFQRTDEQGRAVFQTIYPGWYPGRSVHLHFKIRTEPDNRRGREFVSQLYFDDAFTDQVYTQAPYASRGARSTRNDRDGIFRRESGDQLILATERAGTGYQATFDIGLQLT